jgi:hypothetical protein
MSASTPDPESAAGGATGQRTAGVLAGLVVVGGAVSITLGVYGRRHQPTGRPIALFGFPTMLDMKVWLATAALCFGAVQVVTALRMYGRIGHGRSSRAVTITHRTSGVVAIVLSLPVAFHCLWSLGFGTYSQRVLVHSVMGCAFYGIFVSKMLALRVRRLPGWVVPVLGGALFTALMLVWLTSALWYFTHRPLSY